MSTKAKLWSFVGIWLGGGIILLLVAPSSGKNDIYKPQNELKLDPWLNIKIGGVDLSITKAVLYVFLAAVFTCVASVWVARRMHQRPNKVQTAVETLYQLMRTNIVGSNMDESMARKWFPFIGALFLFIMFSNLIGYIPLPVNTEETINVFGIHFPAFALYSATANLSIALSLAIVVFISYTWEGIRKKGVIGYLRSLIPAGVQGAMKPFIFFLELLSNLMRLVSLSVRLFANILAGHLIILFFAGALAVLLGTAAIAWFTMPLAIAIYLFEIVLVAGLQAFIFATLTAIYLGGAVAEHH